MRRAPATWRLRYQAACLAAGANTTTLVLCAAVAAMAASTLMPEAAVLSHRFVAALVLNPQPPTGAASAGPTAAIATAACLILCASALALLRHPARRMRLLSQALAVSAGAIASIALVGYVYGVHSLSGFGTYTQMAVPAAGLFVVMSVGVLSSHETEGVARIFRHAQPGAILARRLLPVVLLGPFALGYVRLQGERAGWYGTELGLAILVIATSLALGSIVVCFASRVDRVDERRRLAEREARITEGRMRFALGVTGTVAWEFSPSTDEVAWSEGTATLFGVDGPTLCSRSAILERVHPDDRALVQEFFLRALEADGRHVVEFRTVWPDGVTHWVHSRAQAVGRPDGGCDALLGVSFDVTDRRSLEDQLRQSQKLEAIGQLAGGVAHDLNNVLTVIVGYSDLVLAQLPPATATHGDVGQIRQAGDRASRIIRQLLAFGRRQILQPRILDVNALIGDLRQMLKPLVREDVTLELRLDDGIGAVKADPIQIEQILLNLVVNARDAMPSGGTLTIETANATVDSGYQQGHAAVEPGEYVMLSVTDTGIGMDAQTRQRIFEPFFTTKAVGKGTGLGLATVFGIVKQSGGYIRVYSEPGCGATFKVYLRRAHESPPKKATRGEVRCVGLGSETILVVEDEPDVRALTCRALEQRGYRVLAAGEPAEALSVARTFGERIHLLLSDIIMPGHSGGTLFEQLTQDRPDLRVLYMSGYADDTIVRKGLLVEGRPFMQKPFTTSALADRVRGVLDRPAA